MPSKFKTKHIHVVFVLIAETLPIFISTRKIVKIAEGARESFDETNMVINILFIKQNDE